MENGAKWALKRGLATESDLERTEENGCIAGADPAQVSERAKVRQRREIGTLGSGNHFLEVQEVERVYDEEAARAIDESLEALQTDHIDHYRLASLDTKEALAQALAPDGAQRAIEEAREAGKVSYTGLTGHRPEVLMAAIETGRFDTMLLKRYVYRWKALRAKRLARIARRLLARAWSMKT